MLTALEVNGVVIVAAVVHSPLFQRLASLVNGV